MSPVFILCQLLQKTPLEIPDCPVFHKVNAVSQIQTEKELLFPEACKNCKETQPKLQKTSYTLQKTT
jgi:hypothetical protein